MVVGLVASRYQKKGRRYSAALFHNHLGWLYETDLVVSDTCLPVLKVSGTLLFAGETLTYPCISW